MTELDKLEAYLKKNSIVYRRIEDPHKALYEHYEGFVERHQIIVYDRRGRRQWDAICQWGSYGYEEGLLEIYGNIVDRKKDGDDVVGYLTAREVIARAEGRA